jgi:hypothetical protein
VLHDHLTGTRPSDNGEVSADSDEAPPPKQQAQPSHRGAEGEGSDAARDLCARRDRGAERREQDHAEEEQSEQHVAEHAGRRCAPTQTEACQSSPAENATALIGRTATAPRDCWMNGVATRQAWHSAILSRRRVPTPERPEMPPSGMAAYR